MEKKVPVEVRLFILRHIDSVEMLEVLLFVYHHADKGWSAEEIATSLRSASESIENRLRALAKDGFLNEGADRKYTLNTSVPEQNHLLDLVDGLYTTYRIRIIELIYSRPNDRIRTFADAFRFKREDNDG